MDTRELELAELIFDIPQLSSRQRVDNYVAKHVKYATRNKVQKAIAEGRVLVNGKKVKNSYGLQAGDQIKVTLLRPASDDMIAEDIPLNIVYEDKDLILINKPAGIAVHPTYKHWSGTLANGILFHHRKQVGDPNARFKPGLIHRLDKNTSGLIVAGKTPEATRGLARQFAMRQTQKVYRALVWGVPQKKRGIIETNLGVSPKCRMRMVNYPYMGPRGKASKSAYELIDHTRYFSLLKVELFTGRTHQIRSHLRHIGHPILGDFIYDGLEGPEADWSSQQDWLKPLQEKLPRQALHAAELGFTHPISLEKMYFNAPLADDIQETLKWLKEQNL